jgi:hypothetical protein
MNFRGILALLTLIIFLTPSASFAVGQHPVKGHVTKKGAYVPPHRKTNPDRSRSNNWSSKGKVNPYTGKKGTVDPYKPRHHR